MYDTHCIHCGTKMNWSTDIPYDEMFIADDDADVERTITEMICPECHFTALFIEPRHEE